LRESDKSRSKQNVVPLNSPIGADSIVSWQGFWGEQYTPRVLPFFGDERVAPFIILAMKTQREHLLELIDKLPDDKFAEASFAMEQVAKQTNDFKARMRDKHLAIRERMQQSLKNVPEILGSRPDLSGGESWTTNAKGEDLDPFFTLHWHEDDGTTHVQKQRWMFRGQGFLTLLRTRVSADGEWYVLSLELGGPGRIASHEERFPVSFGT
jgi:hypothetical protein